MSDSPPSLQGLSSQLDMFLHERGTSTDILRNKPAVKRPSLSLQYTSDDMVQALESTGNYRILRRLQPRQMSAARRPGFEFLGVIVDTETTGLNKFDDEVIEIGAILFSFDADGHIGDVLGSYGALQQPKNLIPAEITKLTGINDQMVAGKRIDVAELEGLVIGADLIIAHNAGFDRPFCERLTPAFAQIPWACSNAEIDWKVRGFEGTKLGYLVNQSGFFHDGHRALDDCYALLEVLSQPVSGGQIPLAELNQNRLKNRVRLWAEYAPFDKKELLKARGYRWSNGEDKQPKAWWTEVDAELLAAEVEYLQTEIYDRFDMEPTTRMLSAVDRYKA